MLSFCLEPPDAVNSCSQKRSTLHDQSHQGMSPRMSVASSCAERRVFTGEDSEHEDQELFGPIVSLICGSEMVLVWYGPVGLWLRLSSKARLPTVSGDATTFTAATITSSRLAVATSFLARGSLNGPMIRSLGLSFASWRAFCGGCGDILIVLLG